MHVKFEDAELEEVAFEK